MSNKQPIFTASPILYNNIYDPDIFDFLNPSIGTYFYATTTITLIDRVTVQIPVNKDNRTYNTKTIYIILEDISTSNYSIYQREDIIGDDYTNGTGTPAIVWNFQGGLILPSGSNISVQASTNASTSGNAGDRLSVTIEGGTYN